MKRLLTIGTLCLLCNTAHALNDTQISSCTTATYELCPYGTYAPTSCNVTACNTCQNGSSYSNTAGIVTKISAGTYSANCGIEPHTCSCKGQTTTYECAGGYYGRPTNSQTGCTICPDNATCPYGNNTTFTCNANYLKSGNSCIPCPTIGVYSCSGDTLICAKGYYRNVNRCSRCPSSGGVYGTTHAPSPFGGATSITDCYIPANTMMSGSDASGSYEYYFINETTNDFENCYYTN